MIDFLIRNIGTVLVLLIIVSIITVTLVIFIRNRKKGGHCANCPYSGTCSDKNNCENKN